jgi:hypothetical protein
MEAKQEFRVDVRVLVREQENYSYIKESLTANAL